MNKEAFIKKFLEWAFKEKGYRLVDVCGLEPYPNDDWLIEQFFKEGN